MAGIELGLTNNPVFDFNRPKWIRPVCNTEHGQIPDKIAEPFKLLDIIELDVLEEVGDDYQSENVTFKETTIKTVNAFDKESLKYLCDDKKLVFGGKGKAVSQELIEIMEYSLTLINVNQFDVIRKTYDDRAGRPQLRMQFTYNGNSYDFPITDPAFIYKYKNNPEVLKDISQLYLCISLGIEWENWYYKLVAGIIF